MEEINRTYEEQLWDLYMWTVRSFHDNTGTALAGTVTADDSTILKTAGSLTTNTNVADLHLAKVMFASVRVNFDFSQLNSCNVKLSLDTFIQLPQHTRTVHNGTGGDLVLATFHGHDDITSYSKEEF